MRCGVWCGCWRPCTFDRRIGAGISDCRCLCIHYCYCLAAGNRCVVTCIHCIPCSCYCSCTRSAAHYIKPHLLTHFTTPLILYKRWSERWRPCTFDRRIGAGISDCRCLCIHYCYCLAAGNRWDVTCIHCIPCSCYCSCTRCAPCYITAHLVHRCTTARIRCGRWSERRRPCTSDQRNCLGISDCRRLRIHYCYCLAAGNRCVVTCIHCIPCSCYCSCTR